MNNKGFASFSFISLTPLLLLLAFTFCWSYWFLNQKHRVDNLCNYHVLKAQEILLENNNLVLNLNSKAWALILEKRSLDALILVAPPPVKIPAKARRRIVVAQQYTLKKIQQALLFKANIRSRAQAYLLKKEFKKLNREMETHWNSKKVHPIININWKESKIEPRFKEIAPPYKRKREHGELQEIKAYWEIPLAAIIPKWLQEFVSIKKIWTGACYSHPREGRVKWSAQIGKAKPSLKQLY